jgi:hypothetical protein
MADFFAYDLINSLLEVVFDLLENHPELNENRLKLESLPGLVGFLTNKSSRK